MTKIEEKAYDRMINELTDISNWLRSEEISDADFAEARDAVLDNIQHTIFLACQVKGVE